MRSILYGFLLLSECGNAESIEAPLGEPKALLKIVNAIECSKIAGLSSHAISNEETTYHLAQVKLLGTVNRDGQTYSIAYAKFLRSRNPASDTPPARGHGYLIILDGRFDIVSRAAFDDENFSMRGDLLIQGDAVIADFQANDEQTRHGGFVDGMLSYPFKDRISDADWESGAFRKKN